jgi:hypothetical protein
VEECMCARNDEFIGRTECVTDGAAGGGKAEEAAEGFR